jgi:hypothetical protein
LTTLAPNNDTQLYTMNASAGPVTPTPDGHAIHRSQLGAALLRTADRTIEGTSMRTIILTASALAAAFAIATAAAAQPRAVKIEVKTPTTGGAGTFTTSGAGLCRRGATHDKIFTRPKAGNHSTLRFRKTFRCSNHAGTFVVEVRGHVTGVRASGGWKIVNGTGAYAKLEGSGSFAAHWTATGFLDHYRGTISL